MTETRRIHELKTAQPYYDAVASGMKTFDVRRATRPFHVGDHLHLQEYVDGQYTGREEQRVITYVMDDPPYVLPGTVVLGIRYLVLGDFPTDDVPVLQPPLSEPATQPGDLLKLLTDAIGHFSDACCLAGGCYCPPVEAMALLSPHDEGYQPCGGTRCNCGAEDTARRMLPVVEALIATAAQRLPEHLRGDGPCSSCGTLDNIVWFTDNVFWNAVVRTEPRLTDDAEILCIPCFVKMADARGYRCNWRLTPEFHWETKVEADARRSR